MFATLNVKCYFFNCPICSSTVRSLYEVFRFSDRRASSLSRRAATPAFSDDLYADIAIPEELSRPRRRPVSLQKESALTSADETSAASRASK